MTTDHARTLGGARQVLVPALGLLLVLQLAACSGGGPGLADGVKGDGPAPRFWPGADDQLSRERQGCDVLAGPVARGGVFTVALIDSVLPHRAPVPHNDAERLVFAQLYETLVRVDCDGALRPGLATHWTCTADSTVWIFALRPGARFWDGTPVTAADVKSAWRSDARCPRASGRLTPWNWLDAGAESIEALDVQRLKIQLPEPQGDLPRLLAHPAAAVAVDRPGWTWPVGSGPARLQASTPEPLPDLVCRPNIHHPEAPRWQELIFQIAPDRDPRDLVHLDADLMRVRRLDAVRFYDETPGYEVHPLPWDRLYILICPPEANPGGTGAWLAAAGRLDPARGLTGVTARRWDDLSFPAGGPTACPQLTGPVGPTAALRRDSALARARVDGMTLVHRLGDAAATELAGRLAALAVPGTRAVGLEDDGLQAALSWQMAGGLIIAQDLSFPGGCLQTAALLGRAGWLQAIALQTSPVPPGDSLVAADRETAPLPDPARALAAAGVVRPLALTRPWLVARTGLGGLALDFDGTPRLAGLGRAQLPEPTP